MDRRFETLKRLLNQAWAALYVNVLHPEYDPDSETVKILKGYLAEPGFVGDRSSRPIILSTPQPCARCGAEETVLMFPQIFCGECFTSEYPLYVVEEPCRCDDCCLRFAEMIVAARKKKLEEG